MKPVTNLDIAKQLPERDIYDIIEERQLNGTIMKRVVFRHLAAVDYDPAAILLFQDRDGRLMTIGYDSDGPYKQAVNILSKER